MNTRTRIIERANKRLDMMVNECLPPPLTFTEGEVLEMLWEIEDNGNKPKSNPNPSEEEINEIYADKQIVTSKHKIREAYQNACRKKGMVFGPDKTPEGAFN